MRIPNTGCHCQYTTVLPVPVSLGLEVVLAGLLHNAQLTPGHDVTHNLEKTTTFLSRFILIRIQFKI